jgi:hypothetical protein
MTLARYRTVFVTALIWMLIQAQRAWAVQSDGSLGANLIASIVNTATQVVLPAALAIGFVTVIATMCLGRGGAFIQRFGFWILAIIVAGGGFVYFSGFAGGPVSMTFLVRGL